MDNKISILDTYGEDFTKKEYITNPAIGRDEEIKQMILVLLTPEKSVILTGKPGVGKTAIVEGLAYRIEREDVPDALKGYTVIKVNTLALMGTTSSGEAKIQLLLNEVKEREKLILFIDEIHTLIGGKDEALDFANIFKPGLDRGDIKVIGATTTEEYDRFILRDKAFVRRFQKIVVEEPTEEQTVEILMGTLPKIEKKTGVKLKYTKYLQELIMKFIVDITSEYKRVYEIGARYPDVSLSLLQQAFSYAVFDNKKEVNIEDVKKAVANTKNIYPDVVKKALEAFPTYFKEIYKVEQEEQENRKRMEII